MVQFVLLWLVIATGVGFGGAWTKEAVLHDGRWACCSGWPVSSSRREGLLDLRGALTPLPRPREGAELVEIGVYRLVRHPVYGGLVLAAVGWGLFTASVVALATAPLLLGFFRLKSGREEAWLRERYPAYEAYAARTKRMIPWVY